MLTISVVNCDSSSCCMLPLVSMATTILVFSFFCFGMYTPIACERLFGLAYVQSVGTWFVMYLRNKCFQLTLLFVMSPINRSISAGSLPCILANVAASMTRFFHSFPETHPPSPSLSPFPLFFPSLWLSQPLGKFPLPFPVPEPPPLLLVILTFGNRSYISSAVFFNKLSILMVSFNNSILQSFPLLLC